MIIGTPTAVVADPASNVYFTGLECVFRLDPNGVVTRIAGNSRSGYGGDGGPSADAQLSVPAGLALDSSGNLFIADSGNYRVRRISPDGIIVTVAGNGSPGYSGERGPAVSAAISATALSFDNAGNLFIAGFNPAVGGGRVLKVSPAGVISTVAGTGSYGFSGDNGPATQATFSELAGIAVDQAGNLFIADYYNRRLRKVSPDGVITTVAGGGTDSSGNSGPATNASLDGPGAVIVDAAGNVIFSDFSCYEYKGCPSSDRVRALSPNGTLTTIAGNGPYYNLGDGGPALNAGLLQPEGLALSNSGNLLIADTLHGRIRQVNSGGIISTIAGNGQVYNVFSGDGGPATSANLNNPTGMTTDAAGNLYIADLGNGRIRKVSPSGMITTIAGGGNALGEGIPATSATIAPNSVAVDGSGNVFFAEGGAPLYGRVRKVSPDGIITTFASGLYSPSDIVLDPAGNLYFIAFGGLGEISPQGTILWQSPNSSLAPISLAFDNSGNMFLVDDHTPPLVLKKTPDGTTTIIAGGGSGFPVDGDRALNSGLVPWAVAFDESGNLLILYAGTLWRMTADGKIHLIAGANFGPGCGCISGDGGLATNAPLSASGMTVDRSGNIYLAESGPAWSLNNDIRILRPLSDPVFISAVFDAASEWATPMAPGKIALIYGGNLGPAALAQSQPTAGRFSTQLNGTSITFNGIPAPILYTSSTQVAVIVPYVIGVGTAQVVLTYQGQASAAFAVPVMPSAPSLFTVNQTGAGQAAAINVVDETVNSAINPVHIGAYISLYATGEGQTTPAGSDGTVNGATTPKPVLPVTATVGGTSANVQYAGGVAGQVAGLMQVNVQIPNGVKPGGDVLVVVTVGNAQSGPGVWIAVAN